MRTTPNRPLTDAEKQLARWMLDNGTAGLAADPPRVLPDQDELRRGRKVSRERTSNSQGQITVPCLHGLKLQKAEYAFLLLHQ